MRFYKDIIIILVSWHIYGSFVLIMWYQFGHKSIIDLINLLLTGLIPIGLFLFKNKFKVIRKPQPFKVRPSTPQKEIAVSLNQEFSNDSKEGNNFTLPNLDYNKFFNLNFEELHDLD